MRKWVPKDLTDDKSYYVFQMYDKLEDQGTVIVR